jgi:transcription-repair coupling factor (superfamily II helicase)
MSLKNDILRCFFINRPDSPYFESELFNSILNYLQTRTNKAKLKQVGKLFMLIAQPVKTMQELHSFLSHMHKEVSRKQPILP